MKQYVFCLVTLVLLLGWICPQQAVAAKGMEESEIPAIRVGIWSNQPNLLVNTDTDYNIIDADTAQRLGRYGSGDRVAIAIKDGTITLNGVKVKAARLAITVDEDATKHPIEVNRKKYRGTVEFHRTHNKSGLTAVNTLSVEEYLYGVVPKEISPEWNREVLKAQAVAARTYAMSNMNKFASDGYDVCPTTECQVYAGLNSEAVQTNQAVDETAGLVLTYQGKTISAVFHSSSGGRTEDSEAVWGTVTPYLKSVIDYDQKSPNYFWEKHFTAAQVDTALKRGGCQIGHIQAFELSILKDKAKNPAGEMASDRGISGRLKDLRLIGSAGSIELSGNKFRSLLNLPSTLFDIQIMVSSPEKLEFDISGDYGSATKEVPAKLPMFPQRKNPGDGENIRRLLDDPKEVIVIRGYGYGHGLGLSQWGAKAMADKAPVGDSFYFRQILKHYYQGVEITKFY